MKLPPDYSEIVVAGARALRAIEGQLRAEAAHRPDAPELWLSIRDIAGLAARLGELEDWEWRTGFAGMTIIGQDIGVLIELDPAVDAARAPEDMSDGQKTEVVVAVRQLRAFLTSYLSAGFEFDPPSTVPSKSQPPAA